MSNEGDKSEGEEVENCLLCGQRSVTKAKRVSTKRTHQ